MPTATIHQIETLPEGLVTIENMNAKVPLIEVPPTETETTPLVELVKEAVEDVTTPEVPPEVPTTEQPVETPSLVTNLELLETPKHTINLSKFENLTLDVSIVKEKVIGPQRCYIMTVHDIGFDNTQFDAFINSTEMEQLRNRTVWLNVTLPGQEFEASDVTVSKYPTLSELADELVTVMDYFGLNQTVLLGEGVGATICTHFAIRYPNRCYGLMLIEPIVTSRSYMEVLKHKLQNFKLSRQKSISKSVEEDKKSDSASETIVAETTTENETFHLQPVDTTITHIKFKNRNVKNVTMFAEAFLNRPNLLDSVSKLECDILIATNKGSPTYSESKKFFRAISECYMRNSKSLVNVPFIETRNDSGKILENSTEQFATSLQYFLQGIGLLSAMPLRKYFIKQASKEGDTSTVTTTSADVTEITPVVEAATEKTIE